MTKRLIAALLAVMMVLALVPTAMAAPEDGATPQLKCIPLDPDGEHGPPHLGDAQPLDSLTITAGNPVDVIFGLFSGGPATWVEPSSLTPSGDLHLTPLRNEYNYPADDGNSAYYVRVGTRELGEHTVTIGEAVFTVTVEPGEDPGDDPGPGPGGEDDPNQLYFTFLHWMPDGKPHMPEDPESYVDMKMTPSGDQWVAFGTRDENGRFVPVLPEELTAVEGLHVDPATIEIDYSDSEDPNIPYYARVVVEEFFQEYQVSYGERSLCISTWLDDLTLLTKNELNTDYVTPYNSGDISLVNPHQEFYLLDATSMNIAHGQDGYGRAIQSVTMATDRDDNDNDQFTLTKLNDGAYSIQYNGEISLDDEPGVSWMVSLKITHLGGWEDYQDFHFNFNGDYQAVYTTEKLPERGGELTADILAKCSNELDLEVGVSKDVYIYHFWYNWDDGYWMYISPSFGCVGTLDTDALDVDLHEELFWPDFGEYDVINFFTVTANKEGTYEIQEGNPTMRDQDGNVVDQEAIGDYILEWSEENAPEMDWMNTGYYWYFFEGLIELKEAGGLDRFYSIPAEGWTPLYGYFHWGTPSITVKVTEPGSTPTSGPTSSPSPSPSPTVDFADMPKLPDYANAITWAVENGITTGTTNTTFGPDELCNRAQIATFLWRAAGEPAPTTTVNPFVDVPAGAYYYDAVLWAKEKGITTGVDATHFGPNEKCTRGQIVTFIHRAKDKPAYTAAAESFNDVPSGAFYHDAVLWAVENGITKGVNPEKKLFGPLDSCTRAQAVTFLHRAYR